jgi:TolB-like protein
MTERLRTALARFETVNIVDDVADDAGRPTAAADYELIGSGEFKESGGMAVRFRLFDVPAATTIWSRDFELPVMSDYSPVEEKIATQLAQTLAPPFGARCATRRTSP